MKVGTANIQSSLISVVAQSSTWASIPWQAPSPGVVMGVLLSYHQTIAAGVGNDIATYVGVYQTAQTSSLLGTSGNPPNPCYAFLSDSANEIIGAAQHLVGNAYIPMRLQIQPAQQIFLSAFTDSTVHAVVAHAVVQFMPNLGTPAKARYI